MKLGMFQDQKGVSGARTGWSTRRLSKKSQGHGARCMASKALGWSLCFIVSTTESQEEDFRHRWDMI